MPLNRLWEPFKQSPIAAVANAGKKDGKRHANDSEQRSCNFGQLQVGSLQKSDTEPKW
jgi:hypothetical protein